MDENNKIAQRAENHMKFLRNVLECDLTNLDNVKSEIFNYVSKSTLEEMKYYSGHTAFEILSDMIVGLLTECQELRYDLENFYINKTRKKITDEVDKLVKECESYRTDNDTANHLAHCFVDRFQSEEISIERLSEMKLFFHKKVDEYFDLLKK